VGVEPGRLQFSWISSAEAGKFIEVAEEIADRIRALGPFTYLVKTRARLP